MSIRTKQEFLEASMSLRLGNRVRNWGSLRELMVEPHKPPTVTCRYKIPGAPFVKFGIPIHLVEETILNLCDQGADSSLFFFNENPQDDRLLIQGEVQRLPTGLYMLYSYAKKPMRTALAEQSLHAERSKASAILAKYLDGNSLDDLHDLLDRYDDHVVEFSCYDYQLGILPNRNTIIWEVRQY